jgi:hypothetical protein
MANRIQAKIRKLESLRDNLNKETSYVLSKYKKEIVRLNKNQMIDGYGSDNKDLFNVLRQYDGIYNRDYKKTGLYDFFETGVFIRGLFAEVNNNKIFVDSTGKGTGDKSLFFAGYTNMFGLNDYSMKKLRSLIMPELRKYLKSKL